MKVNFSYKQNEDKIVNRYVSAPLVTNPEEIIDVIYNTAAAMSKAAFGKSINVVVYDVFSDPMNLTYTNNEFYWSKS